MRGDGNGWLTCDRGHRHWGRHGAAGLFLRHIDETGTTSVLLQHRAGWSHHGGTWGLPGGARDSHETAEDAALREATEETGLDVTLIRVLDTLVDDHGGWRYVSVLAEATSRVPARAANAESIEVSWVPAAAVGLLPLHPGFAATWPRLADM